MPASKTIKHNQILIRPSAIYSPSKNDAISQPLSTNILTLAKKSTNQPFYQQHLVDIHSIQAKVKLNVLQKDITKIKQELIKFAIKYKNADSSLIKSVVGKIDNIDEVIKDINSSLDILTGILQKNITSKDVNKSKDILSKISTTLKDNKKLILTTSLIFLALCIKQGAWYATQFIDTALSFWIELSINHCIALFEFIPSIIAISILLNNKFDVSLLNALIISLDLGFLLGIQNAVNSFVMKPKHYASLSLLILSSLVLNDFHSTVFNKLTKKSSNTDYKTKKIENTKDIITDDNHDLESGVDNLKPREIKQIIPNINDIMASSSQTEQSLDNVAITTKEITTIVNSLKQHQDKFSEQDNQFIQDLSHKLSNLNSSASDLHKIFSQLTEYIGKKSTDLKLSNNKKDYSQFIFFAFVSIAYISFLTAALTVKNSDNKISLSAIASIFARIPAWFFFASKSDKQLKELFPMLKNLDPKALMVAASWGRFAFIEYIALTTTANHTAKKQCQIL
jgi:uncharacterized protein YoxC